MCRVIADRPGGGKTVVGRLLCFYPRKGLKEHLIYLFTLCDISNARNTRSFPFMPSHATPFVSPILLKVLDFKVYQMQSSCAAFYWNWSRNVGSTSSFLFTSVCKAQLSLHHYSQTQYVPIVPNADIIYRVLSKLVKKQRNFILISVYPVMWITAFIPPTLMTLSH